ncbi:hypothetical protein B0H34DRAFT_755406 [Crassisporium funariophilum]|nr:hypothetical protein B0H34DRAFT_755406 [Crassisporium funariophilum]
MSTKHLYNSADGLVLKSLKGAVALNPVLRLHASSKSVYLAHHSPAKRVSVISGGGAGHEPAHAGYTGAGMLSACVSGEIFASPSAKQILTAIKLAAFSSAPRSSSHDAIPAAPTSGTGTVTERRDEPRDVLVVINNYTGDRLNFGLAIEKARSTITSGMNIASVVVADDVALLRKPGRNLVGPRGLAGNIIVCKILGAFAERGATLDEVKALGDAVVANLSSVGVGLEHCHVPGRWKADGGGLGEEECEVGLGLHNEPGVLKHDLGQGGGERLVIQMVDMILGEGDAFVRGRDEEVDEVVLFVNNLGGMSQLEMGAVVHDALVYLATKRIRPRRIYSSSYMTSLNAPGFSISLLNTSFIHRSLSTTPVDSPSPSALHHITVYDLLDDPTDATAWIGVRLHWPDPSGPDSWAQVEDEDVYMETWLASLGQPIASPTSSSDTRRAPSIEILSIYPFLKDTISGACMNVLDIEQDLTRFDTAVGDGDCGETFASGARAVMAHLHEGNLISDGLEMFGLIRRIANILEDSMGGTIGALFAIFLNALASSLQHPPPTSTSPPQNHSQSWGAPLTSALASLSIYTPAKPGDRTIIDALHPFVAATRVGRSFSQAVRAAKAGAESTRGMEPSLGRAVYSAWTVGDGADVTPDPGAWGVAAILEGMVKSLNGKTL